MDIKPYLVIKKKYNKKQTNEIISYYKKFSFNHYINCYVFCSNHNFIKNYNKK
jgi:hypothetical protein